MDKGQQIMEETIAKEDSIKIQITKEYCILKSIFEV
tara:strand:- start:117 stop:224 length:108 start_codon:yes stop_codon:yes gene_type:complete